MNGLRPESEVLPGHHIAYAVNKIPTCNCGMWGTRLPWGGNPAWSSLITVLLGDYGSAEFRARLHDPENGIARDHPDNVGVVGA